MERWKQELKRVVDYLNSEDEGTKELWNVLTALRGPDSDITEDKLATTAVIRHAVGLENHSNGALVNADNAEHATLRAEKFPVDYFSLDYGDAKVRMIYYTHFSSHALAAFEALGLKWDLENSQINKI